jgi:hypothetical protein
MALGPQYAMSMTLSVKDKNENTIFNWRPQGKTW